MKQNNPQKDHGFYAPIPRIIRTGYKNLTPAQKWVYVCLRDVCGEHGTCFRSLRTLSVETGLSTGMLSESIRALHEVGLIHAEKKRRSEKPTAKEVWHISIVDIWQANALTHPTKRSQNEQSTENVQSVNDNVHNVNDTHAQECSQNEQQCSQNETEGISIEGLSLHEEISGEEEKAPDEIPSQKTTFQKRESQNPQQQRMRLPHQGTAPPSQKVLDKRIREEVKCIIQDAYGPLDAGFWRDRVNVSGLDAIIEAQYDETMLRETIKALDDFEIRNFSIALLHKRCNTLAALKKRKESPPTKTQERRKDSFQFDPSMNMQLVRMK